MPSARPPRRTSRGRPPRRSISQGRRAESFADDLNTRRGIVSGRVALLPRSTEIQPHVARIRPSPLTYNTACVSMHDSGGPTLCGTASAHGHGHVGLVLSAVVMYVCMHACKLYRWAAPCLHAHRISSQVFTFMPNKSDIIHVALGPHYKLAFAIMDVGM